MTMRRRGRTMMMRSRRAMRMRLMRMSIRMTIRMVRMRMGREVDAPGEDTGSP